LRLCVNFVLDKEDYTSTRGFYYRNRGFRAFSVFGSGLVPINAGPVTRSQPASLVRSQHIDNRHAALVLSEEPRRGMARLTDEFRYADWHSDPRFMQDLHFTASSCVRRRLRFRRSSRQGEQTAQA